MVAKGCQGSPEVPVDLKRGLQTALGPGGAANGQIRRNRGSSPLLNSGVGGMAQPLNNSSKKRHKFLWMRAGAII